MSNHLEIRDIDTWTRQLARSVHEACDIYLDMVGLVVQAMKEPSREAEALGEVTAVAQRVGLPMIAACRQIEDLTRIGVLPEDGHPRAVIALARVVGESLVLMLSPSVSALAGRPLINPSEVARLREEPEVAEWFARWGVAA